MSRDIAYKVQLLVSLQVLKTLVNRKNYIFLFFSADIEESTDHVEALNIDTSSNESTVCIKLSNVFKVFSIFKTKYWWDNLFQSEECEEDGSQSYTILDVLNQDCLIHVLSYVPIRDLIRSERVSKRWQNMVQEYLHGKLFNKCSELKYKYLVF